MRSVPTFAAIVASVVGTSAYAAASCDNPRVIVTPSGGRIPKNPTVYVFAPRDRRTTNVRVRVEGDASIDGKDDLPSGPALSVWRVRLSAGDGARFTIVVDVDVARAFFPNPLSHRYDFEVAARWHAPASTGVVLLNVHRTRYQWMCSENDTLDARPSVDAPAYRVRWASSREALDDGRGDSVVVPRNLGLVWPLATSPMAPALNLGFSSCLGPTVPHRLATMRFVAVDALFEDGRETPAAHMLDVSTVPVPPMVERGMAGESPPPPPVDTEWVTASMVIAACFSIGWRVGKR